MPFVVNVGGRKSSRTREIGATPVFIGRLNEIKFVQQQLIDPEVPGHNIVCFHGQGGIGKSTLLGQLAEIVGASEQKRPPLFAYVNERQPTPVEVMQAFAKRLKMRGAFEKALETYKETLRKIRQDRQEAEETFGRKITGQVTKAVAESVPFVGTFIKEGAEQVSNLLWDELHDRRRRKDAGHLEDPLRDLTQAFVSELNKLAEAPDFEVFSDDQGGRRTFLCFDTFEYIASQIELWLLDTFLAEEIHANVVILIAGRNSLSLDPIHWLKYAADETLHQIEIKPFSKEETRLYLSEAQITDETRVDQIWKLSRGLPLYLRMLTFSRDVEIDPTENVVENFLRWIPADEPHKRRLLLDAALFSHTFNRDDLKAFSYVSDDERETLYRWLRQQPFVSGKDGRNLYHDVARNLFLRYLFQRSPDDCRAARSAIADYYQAELTHLESADIGHASETEAWFELALALISQLFLLPEDEKHLRATNLVVRAIRRRKDEARNDKVNRDLGELSDASNVELSAKARSIIRTLLIYNGDATDGTIWHNSSEALLKTLSIDAQHTTDSLVSIYMNQVDRFRSTGDAPRALQVCDQAVKICPDFAIAWNHKGFLLADSNRFEDAVEAYRESLRISPEYVYAWFNQGVAFSAMKKWAEALTAFDEAIRLQPSFADAHFNRGAALYALGSSKDGDIAVDEALRAASLGPSSAQGQYAKGKMLASLDRSEEALAAFNSAIELASGHAGAWREKGNTLITLRRSQEAAESLERALELDSRNAVAWINHAYALTELQRYQEAARSCQRAIDIDPLISNAWNSKGYALMSLKQFDEALASFNKAIEIEPDFPNPWRLKGRTMRELKRPDEALECFDKAISLNLGYARAQYDRAALLAEMGPYDTALAAYEEAMDSPAYDQNCYEEALDFYSRAVEEAADEANLWGRKGQLLAALGRDNEADLAYERAVTLNPEYHNRGNWSTRSGFGKYVSPTLVQDRFLDVKIVMLLNGTNLFGDDIYSYVEINGRNLKKMFAKMQAGEDFKPTDFGEVLAAGRGDPPPEVREEMRRTYNMIEVPVPSRVVPVIPSNSPEG